MDLITLDATKAEGLSVGDTVQLIGPQYGINELSADAGTIPYEILTSLGHRYHRQYTGGDTRVKEPTREFSAPHRCRYARLSRDYRTTVDLHGQRRLALRPPAHLFPLDWPANDRRRLLLVTRRRVDDALLRHGHRAAKLHRRGPGDGGRGIGASQLRRRPRDHARIGACPGQSDGCRAYRYGHGCGNRHDARDRTNRCLDNALHQSIKYLVVPRIIAGLTMLPLLVLVGDVIGIFGGYIVGVYKLDFNAAIFIQRQLNSSPSSTSSRVS